MAASMVGTMTPMLRSTRPNRGRDQDDADGSRIVPPPHRFRHRGETGRLAFLFSGNREHLDRFAPADQGVEQRAAEPLAPGRPLGLADHDAVDVVLPGVRQDLIGDALARSA